MLQSSATVRTPNAGRYVAQLCKHFGHKVDVVEREKGGEIRFSCGTADLDARPDALVIAVTSPTETDLADTKDVVERHLLRFAFREELGPLGWA
jgi:hypothetical protein